MAGVDHIVEFIGGMFSPPDPFPHIMTTEKAMSLSDKVDFPQIAAGLRELMPENSLVISGYSARAMQTVGIHNLEFRFSDINVTTWLEHCILYSSEIGRIRWLRLVTLLETAIIFWYTYGLPKGVRLAEGAEIAKKIGTFRNPTSPDMDACTVYALTREDQEIYVSIAIEDVFIKKIHDRDTATAFAATFLSELNVSRLRGSEERAGWIHRMLETDA